MSTATSAIETKPDGGPMVELTSTERRQVQQQVLATPPRAYGLDARFIFWMEDRAWGRERSLFKFRARELVARSPYRAWSHDRAHEPSDDEEAANERSHWNVLRELLREDAQREHPIRFGLVAALSAAAMYTYTRIQHRIDPSHSHRLNADIEDHAQHEYARLVAEHPEWEDVPYTPVVRDYGTYESRADLLRQLCCDERAHMRRSLDLAETA